MGWFRRHILLGTRPLMKYRFNEFTDLHIFFNCCTVTSDYPKLGKDWTLTISLKSPHFWFLDSKSGACDPSTCMVVVGSCLPYCFFFFFSLTLFEAWIRQRHFVSLWNVLHWFILSFFTWVLNIVEGHNMTCTVLNYTNVIIFVRYLSHWQWYYIL